MDLMGKNPIYHIIYGKQILKMKNRRLKAMNQEPISITPTDSRLLGIKELMSYTSLGRNSAMQLGMDSGAKVKIGGRVLYDRKKIDSYIDSLAAE